MNTLNLILNQAIALSDQQNSSPRITAKGNNELAKRIIEVAREHNIPIKEEPELVKLLSEVPLGEEIPNTLYVAVAEVLSFAYMLRDKVKTIDD